MYDYIIGKIVEIKFNSIVLDNHGIGYLVYVANPYFYQEGIEYKVYLYQQVKEDEHTLFGFKDIPEKELFLKLISVKGLGCKMALPMFATGSSRGIIDAIDRENILYLKKFPKIGDKLARQIILDLKGKLKTSDNNTIVDQNQDELIDVLRGLGYKEKEVKGIVGKVDSSLNIEQQVKEALRLLLK